MRIKKDRSVGAIVLNSQNKVLVLFQKKHRFWEFPKGGFEKGETEEGVLKRELAEETGIKNFELVQGFRTKTHYTFRLNNSQYKKEVVYYLIQSNDLVRISSEHLSFKWLSISEARKYLIHQNLRHLLVLAKKFLKLS